MYYAISIRHLHFREWSTQYLKCRGEGGNPSFSTVVKYINAIEAF